MTGSREVYVSVDGLRELVDRQHGVVTRSQLSRLGVGPPEVACHLAALRWRALSEQVLVTHRGPLTRAARRWAAVLGAPAGSVIGAWSALEVGGLEGWHRDPIHVVVPRGAYPDRHPWLVVHESRRLREEDAVDAGGLPVHSIARAAVDAGAWQRSWRTAAGLMAAVVQQRLGATDDLFAMLDTVGKVRHRKVMRLALADIVGGADSLAEIDFARLCRRGGLPEPARQAVRTDARGRRRFLDVEWRLPGGRRFVVEIDGVGHLERDRWYDDLLRDAELGADAATVRIRLPAMAARYEPERVLAVVRRHLGW
ncbi:hypothetical protein [Isoptericola sp. NPDC057391]|uniref:hypothetical protein n=1 Tax=Isoptericola sp. NPDC057391 TaxID=3346117 RepID=UPI00362744BA